MAAPKSYKDPAWDKAEQEASAKTGVPAEVLAAIRLHGEKSNADQVSPKGAKGVYQFTPETEKLFAKKYGVSAYSDDPVEQATAAAYHLKESYERTKDWGKAAAGYNGGRAGEKNPRFTKETAEYYDRVVAALPVGLRGPQTAGPDAEPDATGTTRRGAPSYDDFMAGRTIDPVSAAGAVAPSKVMPAVAFRQMEDDREVAAAIRGVNQDQQAKQAKADAQPWITAGGLYDRGSTVGAFYSDMMAPLFKNYDRANVKADPAYLAAVSADSSIAFAGVDNPNQDEQEDLLSARSAEDRDAIRARLLTKREDEAVMANASTFGGLAAGLVTGGFDPFTWITGIGAAKAFYAAGRGAIVLARGGHKAAAIAASAGENALGNVAYEAVRGLAGEHQTVADYALAGATGMLPALLGVPGLSRTAAEFHARAHEAVLAKQEPYLRRAAETLGEGADPAAVRKLAAELEHEDAVSALAATRTRENKVIAPDLDDPEVQAANAEAAEPAQFRGDETKAWHPDRPAASDLHLESNVEKYGITRSAAEIRSLQAGTHLDAATANSPAFKEIAKLLEKLRAKYVPDMALHVQRGTAATGRDASLQLGDNKHAIFLTAGEQAQSTAIHELGHVIFERYASKLPQELREAMVADWQKWKADFEAGGGKATARERMGTSRIGMEGAIGKFLKDGGGSFKDAIYKAVADSGGNPDEYLKYFTKLDEFAAEQFVKKIEADVAAGKFDDTSVLGQLKTFIKTMLSFWKEAKESGAIKPTESFNEFFDRAAAGTLERATTGAGELQRMAQPVPAIDTRFGLTALSGSDPTTRMRRKALRNLIEYCEQEMRANPIDKERTKTIMKNSLFNMATPGLQLALSDHPVAQWASRHLVENTMGGSGREVTAAIRKAQYELEFVGAGINIIDQAFESWKARQGVGLAQGLADDLFKGNLLDAFDRKVYAEIENRRWGKPTSQDPDVIRAADAIQVQEERMLRAQKENKTVGWAMLPDNSVGYIQHSFNVGKLGTMSNTRRETMRTIIRDQMVDILGFDKEFAEKLSGAYMNHARTNANGGHEIPANVLDPHAPEYIRQAAQAAGMTEDEIHALGKKLSAGGPTHTKKRLNLDLTKEYTDAEGTFTLMDMMNTDVRSLLKNQARRVAGEVAVTQQGVYGSAGLKLMEEALHYTENGKVDVEAVRAFQQVSAELLGRPYGDKMPTLAEGAMTVNAAASLGQMVIPQITETLNMAAILGITSTMKGIASLPRMIGEVRRLARGDKVEGLLSSMEVPGGEFGMTDYRLVTRWDSPSAMYDTVGRDQLGTADKLIRAVGRSLGKLSFHRIIQAAQVRASAEQITQKALKYIRDGVQDKALADMGISPELSARIKAELPRIAEFDAAGNTLSLNMHKALDREAVEQFISAVHRGNGQIIQRSYVGEIGPWQHSTLGKLLTQFRTFPITAMEKQWGRQRGLHGAARAMGLVVAVAPFAVPIYLAKVALNAIGRDDPDEYIDRMTTPLALAKGTFNYLGMLGLAPDVLDGLTATPVLGTAIKEALGSDDNKRPGTAGGLGSIVPIVGRADRTLQALQGEGGAKALAQSLPFSNLPYVAPFVNALPTDWE